MAEKNNKIFRMVISIITAAAAWLFVVYNYAPTIDVTYNDIPILFIGEDTLANNGYGVVESSVDSISVTLQQKRVDSAKVSADSITVAADVSEAVEGENGISLQISGPSGTQVIETSTSSIAIKVEEADRRDVDVFVKYSDVSDINVEPAAYNLSSTTVRVVGAKSVVDSVDSAVAFLSYADTSNGSMTFTRELVAVDKEGNIIPHMMVYPGDLNFNAEPAITKEVDLTVNTVDESDDNYTRKVTAPKTIKIKGASDVLDDIDEVQTEEVDISRLYEDTEIDLTYVLPEGVYIANEDLGMTMTVKVAVKEEKEEETESTTDTNG